MTQTSNVTFEKSMASFIDACILLERRERFHALLQSKRGISKWLTQLDHFQRYLDIDRAVSLPRSANSVDIPKIVGIAPTTSSLVFSTLNDYQHGAVVELNTALDATVDMGNGAIICCLTPTKQCWFYIGEEPDVRYFWRSADKMEGSHGRPK
jgi:hypothetical protein